MAKEFKSLMDHSEKSVLIVDGLNLAFRWKHSGATEFSEAYINTVRSLANSYKCGKIIVAADWGSSTFRREKFPDYKGNREALRANQTDEQEEKFKVFIEEFNKTLTDIEYLHNIPVLRYKGVEADDIAAFLTLRKDEFGFDNIWLISSDKDWDLLINNSVSRFSYVTRKEITLDAWSEFYDIDPELYLTYKCLVGDSGDNIPGVSGVGPKRAVSVIQEYGDIFDIYEALPLPGKQKFIQSLNASGEQLLTNVYLMDLLTFCEDAIGKENCEDIRRRLINV